MINVNDNYLEWLSNNPKKWAKSTVIKYESAVRMISELMKKHGVIDKEIYEMSLAELDRTIYIIFQNDAFIKRNKKGDYMYSNGLKQYRNYLAINQYQDKYIDKLEIDIKEDDTIAITEKEVIINARIGQGVFRKKLINKYGKCLITGVDNERLLIASHIKPWAVSNNSERVSVYNGLLLTPTFDKLFDYGLITFTKNGKLLTSQLVGKENELKLHIPTGQSFSLPDIPEFTYNMEYHRDVLFVK